MNDPAQRWGLYPWFPENGADKVHPHDLDDLRRLGPYCRVFEVAAAEAPYILLIHGAQRFRVLADLLREVDPPGLRIGDQVLLSNGAQATVRGVHWHYTRAEPFFLVDVNGRAKSRRYWANELVKMTDVRTRYFHEDDYCQQEFLPLSSWDHCASQIQKIDAFAEAHRTEHGWTKMYLRPAAPDPLAKLRLTVSEVAAVAGPVLAPFSKVTTGYGSYVEECPNVHAFGFEHGLTLFAEANGDTPVSALWLNPWGVDPGEAAGVVNVLAGLPRHQELLFVDWAWSRLFKANDRATWLAYLDEHA